MKILFYDPIMPIAYTKRSFANGAMRGTEATILRIAYGLQSHHDIYIAQYARTTTANEVIDGVHFVSLESAQQLKPDVVILIRRYQLLEEIGKQFPEAQRYLWLHNLPAKGLYKKRNDLIKYHYHVIAVSHFHHDKIEKRLRGKWYQRIFSCTYRNNMIPIHVLYNPIDDDLQPDQTPVDPTQMIFTSSPYKGLVETLQQFTALRRRFPEYKLVVISPDPIDKSIKIPENVCFIGARPYQELIPEIRKSFCVFYPQTERAETFGLVYAEANAVGTPVLAHAFGAAAEVLSDSDQLIDGKNMDSIINKISAWRKVRPCVQGKNEFRLQSVIRDWLKVLTATE